MPRSAFIDATKVLASQVILLHHLSLYSPMSDWLVLAWPRFMGLLAEHGRLAVQPFLVIGGYLAAQSLTAARARPPSAAGSGTASRASRSFGAGWAAAVWQRYLRLLPPLAIALGLVVLATALVGHHLSHEDWLSPQPTPGVLLAHLLMVQDVMGIDSISAGAWYVAIDLQLFALLLFMVRVSSRLPGGLPLTGLLALVTGAAAVSLLLFSRHSGLDEWAIYFFASYGLGALTALLHRHPTTWPWLAALGLLMVADWLWAPRARPAVALATALGLALWARRPSADRAEVLPRLLRHGSDISYSVFVCHFAVIILISGLWTRLDAQGLTAAVIATALTWAAALALGAGVQHVVDRRVWRALPRRLGWIG